MRMKEILQIFVVLILLIFSSVARPVLILMAAISIYRSFILKIPKFNKDKLQEIAQHLYSMYKISSPIIVRLVDNIHDMYPDTFYSPEKIINDTHIICINTTRTLLGKMFPIYKDAVILFFMLVDIKKLKENQQSMFRSDHAEDTTNFVYDAIIQNYKILFGEME